jgi:hypothetical protein
MTKNMASGFAPQPRQTSFKSCFNCHFFLIMLSGGSWTNLSYQDKTWAEISSLDSAVFVWATNCTHFVKQPNLKLKTRQKQLLGSLPLPFELSGWLD